MQVTTGANLVHHATTAVEISDDVAFAGRRHLPGLKKALL